MIASRFQDHDQAVASFSPKGVNDQIRSDTEQRLAYFRRHPEYIDDRLDELAHEWDMERTLEANASTLVLTSLAAAVLWDRRFLLLTGTVAGFLLYHSVKGYCPPVPLFRRMGVRTKSEILRERNALIRMTQARLSHGADMYEGNASQTPPGMRSPGPGSRSEGHGNPGEDWRNRSDPLGATSPITSD